MSYTSFQEAKQGDLVEAYLSEYQVLKPSCAQTHKGIFDFCRKMRKNSLWLPEKLHIIKTIAIDETSVLPPKFILKPNP